MRVALNSNVLAYAEQVGDEVRCGVALELIERIPAHALILSVAAENRCLVLPSEDLQKSFTERGVTVINPFRRPPSPLLGRLLGAGQEPACGAIDSD